MRTRRPSQLNNCSDDLLNGRPGEVTGNLSHQRWIDAVGAGRTRSGG